MYLSKEHDTLTLRHKFIGNPHECAFLSFGKNVGSILAYSCGLLNLCRSKEPAFFGAWLRAAHFFCFTERKNWGGKNMALVQCPECGKEISDQAISCPNCGYTMRKEENVANAVAVPVKRAPNKRLIVVACVVVLLAVVLVAFRSSLNQYEKLALEDCRILKNMLKDPSSMDIYNIYVHPSKEGDDYDTLVFIDYAAANSYGGKIRSVATFEKNTYLGDSGDDEDDFSSQYEYDYFLVANLYYTLRDGENFARVNTEKVVKALAK